MGSFKPRAACPVIGVLILFVCLASYASIHRSTTVAPSHGPANPLKLSDSAVHAVRAQGEQLRTGGISGPKLRTELARHLLASPIDVHAAIGRLRLKPYAVGDYISAVSRLLRSAGTVLPCMHDDTLPTQLSGRFYLAANLKNNEEVLPNFITQLLTLVARMREGQLHISIYESGSTDSTVQWLQLLDSVLGALGVPRTIVHSGNITWPAGGDRIEFLAKVRNAALAPFLEPSSNMTASDHIVFINDVYFCASDVLRLAQHGADLACGLDMWRVLGHVPLLKQLPLLPLEIYDYWVARDIDGRQFNKYAPYVSHPASIARLRAGLPFRVYCGWNGAVVTRAGPFLDGLRFRNRQPGECDSSECSLFCDDLHRLGYHDVVVDPGVRVSYDYLLASDLLGGLVRQSQLLSWRDVTTALDWRSVPSPPVRKFECCPKADHSAVDWDGCHMRDLYAGSNYTQQAFSWKH